MPAHILLTKLMCLDWSSVV